jgi:hypothetical protein
VASFLGADLPGQSFALVSMQERHAPGSRQSVSM